MGIPYGCAVLGFLSSQVMKSEYEFNQKRSGVYAGSVGLQSKARTPLLITLNILRLRPTSITLWHYTAATTKGDIFLLLCLIIFPDYIRLPTLPIYWLSLLSTLLICYLAALLLYRLTTLPPCLVIIILSLVANWKPSNLMDALMRVRMWNSETFWEMSESECHFNREI